MADGVVRKIGRVLEVEADWIGFVSDVEVALAPVDLKTAVHYGLGEREDFLRAARRVRRIARGDDELLARYTLQLRRGNHGSVMALSMDCTSGSSADQR